MVCALAGLGYVFTSGRLRVRLFRRLIVLWMRLLFRQGRVRLILQNDDDAEKLIANGIIPPEQVVMIRGSGVDLDAFRPSPEPDGVPVFTVVSRMLADKGIRELVMAARLLRWRGVPCRVRLVGGPDPHNLSSLTAGQLAAWRAEGVVEWDGPAQDIARVWAESHVCVLPSYREGPARGGGLRPADHHYRRARLPRGGRGRGRGAAGAGARLDRAGRRDGAAGPLARAAGGDGPGGSIPATAMSGAARNGATGSG